MKYELNGREVEISETHFEAGEGCDVIEAQWADSGESLTDRELEELTKLYQSELYEEAYVDCASRAYDMAKDRMKYGE